jgi:hypothetical protein
MPSTTVTVKNKLHDKGTRTGQWAVEVGGTTKSTHRKKSVAISKARGKARKNAPSVLKVQKTNGQWKTVASY